MTDILVPPTGSGSTTFTDGSPYVMIPKVINAAWNQGMLFQATYSTKVTAAQGTYLDIANAPHITSGTVSIPTIAEPNVAIPTTQSAGDVITTFDLKYNELIARLALEFSNFIGAHFPNENTVYTAAESALGAMLANPASYLPANVQQQFFGDDQARIIADKIRAQDSVVAKFAASGFPLPPDAALSAVMQIEQKTQDALAESSRKIAMMSVEQFRFVIKEALDLRDKVLQHAVDYIKALAMGPEMASKLVGIGYDAQSKLISSAADFFNARTHAADVVSKVYQYNNSSILDADSKNQNADLTVIKAKVEALLAEARDLAQMATSLFNNLHVQASISGSTNNSVGYSYSNDTSAPAPTITAAA